MSYEISYRRQVFVMPAAEAGRWDDLLFMVEECGSNNCWEIGNRRRARDWYCLATGSESECMAEAARAAAACCGGSLTLSGRSRIRPEAYIRAWRKAVAEAEPARECARYGFSLGLTTRLRDGDSERENARKLLDRQSDIRPQRSEDGGTVWRFDIRNPEHVRLWMKTGSGARGADVEVSGPA